MYVTLFCFLILFGFLYFVMRSYNYCSAIKLNLPGPIHLPFIGSFIEFWFNKHRFYDWIYDCSKKYGKRGIMYFSIPMKEPYILLLKPEYVKHILSDNMSNYHREPVYNICGELLGSGIFNVDDKKWKQQRRLASHMFSANKLNNLAFNTFVDCANKLSQKISKYAETGKVFDLKDLFFRTTMDSICKIAFDYDVGCLESDEMPEFAKAIDWCTRYLFYRLLNPLWKINKMTNMGGETEYMERIELLNNLCYKIIAERKEKIQNENYVGDDLLSLFMKEMSDKENDDEYKSNFDNYDKYLRDVVFSFIIAGRDTTASTLSWLFYELFENPHVEEKIRQEISEKIVDINNFTSIDCHNLKYMEHTFKETLRLHPPVPMDLKYSKEDDILPDGVHIPKDAVVLYSPYIFGRSSEIYGETYAEFNPDRWTNMTKTDYEFLSFNAGPRICLGRFFAKLEAVVLMSKLLSEFKFEKAFDSKITYSIGVTSTIQEELLVKAIKI